MRRLIASALLGVFLAVGAPAAAHEPGEGLHITHESTPGVDGTETYTAWVDETAVWSGRYDTWSGIGQIAEAIGAAGGLWYFKVIDLDVPIFPWYLGHRELVMVTDGTAEKTQKAMKTAGRLRVVGQMVIGLDWPRVTRGMPPSSVRLPDRPRWLTFVSDARGVLFSATGDAGRELFITDGYSVRMVKDIRPGRGSSNPKGLTRLPSGKVRFTADDGRGRGTWVSDGTWKGTRKVR